MKRQTRKVGVAGGFFNQMMGNNSTTPKVGEGATILFYSDREAYEVTWVSKDGSQCKIRHMKCIYTGSGYGDEQYDYKSDDSGSEILLEWNAKKGKWGKVWTEINVIKALLNRLFDEHGYNWSDNLPNGIRYEDIVDGEYEGVHTSYKLVDGITKEYKCFSPVSIIFGTMQQYRDPSF